MVCKCKAAASEIGAIPPVCKCSRQVSDTERMEATDRRVDDIERRIVALERIVLEDVVELQRIRHGVIPLHKPGVATVDLR